MKALEEKILKEGTVLPGDILKVGSFLNHQIDTAFMMEMGKEIANIYKNDNVTKIVTIETSGLPIAFVAGFSLGCPMVFAKKGTSANVSGEVYKANVYSYTHGKTYEVTLPKQYLNSSDRVVIVDDFLANGKALEGLIDIVNQSGATLVGCTCAIEKGFQKGGDKLREKGIRVESLAVVESMSENSLTFRK